MPCVVAVNKCDEVQHEAGAEEFARLGFPFYPVAAQHNRGMGEFMDAVLPHLPEASDETAGKPLRVAVVGRPNAGKSSLLDYFTNARPKIAPYPFTTKIPNLGMLSVHERDIVIADIPGIIEGAHDGAGLGRRFRKHVSRPSALAFMVDLSDGNWREAFGVLKNELESYSTALAARRRVLVGTKLDLEEAALRLPEFASAFPEESVFGISVF